MFYNTELNWLCEVLKVKHDLVVEAYLTGYWSAVSSLNWGCRLNLRGWMFVVKHVINLSKGQVQHSEHQSL